MNKYQSKKSTQAQNRYLDFLISPSFQGFNRLFVLLFEHENDKTEHTGYYRPKVESKDYNAKIDGRNVFDQPINDDIKTYENIRKIATGQGDDYTTAIDLNIAIDLSKEQALDVDPRAIQQINFTGN